MPIFPPLAPQYADEKDRPVLSKMEAFYTDSITLNQAFWSEADTDTRYEAGDASLWQDIYSSLPVSQRSQFNFNRIRRVINMISGHQRRNRKSTITVPVENGDEQTADQFSKILMWASQQEGILETISESFQGSLVTGMNLLQLWMDYRTDPINGNMKVSNCAYNSFLIDPFFRKSDLSDCNGIWKRSFVSKQEAISLLPENADEIMSLSSNKAYDGKFQFMPENYNDTGKKLLAYDEFYYRDYRTQRLLVDTQTGETMEWRVDDEERLERYLATYPTVTVLNNDIPTVKLAIVVNGKVFYNGPNPMGIDRYPFVPVVAYYNPQMPHFPWRLQGVVRGLRDAQYLYNRRKNIELDILESQVNSGWIYKENALVNPRDVFLSGQGRGLALKAEADMSDVQRIQAPQIPPSMIELSKILAQEVQEISGVNEELLGSATDDKAGILSMLRQGAGLTTLQVLFDNLDRAQKQLGSLMLETIQVNFTPGKVQRIIEEQPSPQFYNKAFGKYDAAIEEGLNTTTQRQLQFAQLLQLKEIGVPIPDEVMLDAATVQNKQKIKDAMTQIKQKQEQIQQIQLDAALKEQEARTKLAQARTIADEGLGLERLSRIDENQALATERRAEASKDNEQALLNLVRALKEIESVDLANIEKMIALSKMVPSPEVDAQRVQPQELRNQSPNETVSRSPGLNALM